MKCTGSEKEDIGSKSNLVPKLILIGTEEGLVMIKRLVGLKVVAQVFKDFFIIFLIIFFFNSIIFLIILFF